MTHVPNDANLVAYYLEKSGIFRPKKICVFPEFDGKIQFFRAYIEVAEWCDRESAYNLIQRIKNPRLEARFVYNDDDWWAIEETDVGDIRYTQSAVYEHWTTNFHCQEEEQEQEQEQYQVHCQAQYQDQAQYQVQAQYQDAKYQELENAFQQVAMMV
jgi:hypothetical protein